MDKNSTQYIEQSSFEKFVRAIGSEIEMSQIRTVSAANTQMLLHYWKVGHYILYHQQICGWGSKIIKKLSQAIRFYYPGKKGYSERNLTYMCQFARTYSLPILRCLIDSDQRLANSSIPQMKEELAVLNQKFIGSKADLRRCVSCSGSEIMQEPLAQFQDVEKTMRFRATGKCCDCVLSVSSEMVILLPKLIHHFGRMVQSHGSVPHPGPRR